MNRRRDKSTETGKIYLNSRRMIFDRRIPVGSMLPDPFLDSYDEERMLCCDILDKVGLTKRRSVTLTFNIAFLKKLVKSHIVFIKTMREQ